MQISFRPARADDAERVVPLMYSSGPAAFDYGFAQPESSASDYLRAAFIDGEGLFGWQNHAVATLDGEVVGVGSFYSGETYAALSRGLLRHWLSYYPIAALPRVAWRGLVLKSLLPPPARDVQYVANLGVAADKRGLGIGEALIRHQQGLAVAAGKKHYALDVALDNPRAQALYERLGFVVIAEQKFRGPQGQVPDARRMQLALQ